jgi:hypothetical protein
MINHYKYVATYMHSTLSIPTDNGLDGWGFDSQQGQEIFLYSQRPERLRASSLLCNDLWLIPWG